MSQNGKRQSHERPDGWSHVDWKGVVLVAAGGALGALLRFGVSSALPRLDFPWHTLLVNLAGAFILGAVFLDHGMEHNMRLFVAVGFLGAFTTMSTFSVETIELWRENHVGLSVINMVANGVGGPLMALAGWKIFGN
jgi:CrcB protein